MWSANRLCLDAVCVCVCVWSAGRLCLDAVCVCADRLCLDAVCGVLTGCAWMLCVCAD